MARRHYWQFLVTDEGNPIENAEISIYIAGTEDPVYVYADEIGSTGTSSPAQTNTSRKGFYEFWIADNQDPNGYSLNTKFKIAWAAPGVQTGYIDYIDVFSTSVAEVDETDINEDKTKVVSNLLAKGWEVHKDSILYQNSITDIHGMTAVDESQDDELDSANTLLNKLVSNILANNWEVHANTNYVSVDDSWGYTIAGGSIIPATENPHGIMFVDTSDIDTERNRLVSNELANQWHLHRTDTTSGSADHTQFPLLDGSRSYTAGVGYSNSSIIDTIDDDDFITKSYITGSKYTTTIGTGDWTDNGDGTYSYILTHNIDVAYPLITVWNLDVVHNVTVPEQIKYLDTNSLEIVYVTESTLFVRISF
ncbi:MAG: hypothetical protein KQ78_01721 [Candidatus Izimaplasma bacterium HR2]|nr:MAG: hypothetical protein KQ78_01721 [Candidatus Izimaplasma bacterium HR2]